jgi:hypothetical protein
MKISFTTIFSLFIATLATANAESTEHPSASSYFSRRDHETTEEPSSPWLQQIAMPKIDIYWNITVDETTLSSTVNGRPFLRSLDYTLDEHLPEFFHGILEDAIAPSLSSRVVLAGVTVMREQLSNTSTLLRLSTQFVGTAQFRANNSRNEDTIATEEALSQVFADYFDNATTGPLRACLRDIVRKVASSGDVTSVEVKLNGQVAKTGEDGAAGAYSHTGTSSSEDEGRAKKDRLIFILGIMLLAFVVLISAGLVLRRRLRRKNLLIEQQLRAAGEESKPPLTPSRSRDRNRDCPNTPSTIHIPRFSISDVDSSTGSDIFHDSSSLDDGVFRNVNTAYASGHWSSMGSLESVL